MSSLPPSIQDEGSRDTRLIQRALEQGWDVPANIKPALVARQARTALKSENDREATQAFLSLLAADKFEWEKKHRHKPDINHQIVQIDWSQFVASSDKQKAVEAKRVV